MPTDKLTENPNLYTNTKIRPTDWSRLDNASAALSKFLEDLMPSNYTRMLNVLCQQYNFNRLVEYEEIISGVWSGSEYMFTKDDVSKLVRRVREILVKAGENTGVAYILVSKPGYGYLLTIAEDQ